MLTTIFLVGAVMFAQAEPKDEAKKLVNRGNQAFALEDYVTALAEYQAAYELYPSPKILLNIAETYKSLESWSQAVLHYERYLADATQEDELVGQVESRIAELEDKIGRLDFVVADDAEITVDGSALSGTKAVVDPGTHQVVVKREGYHDFMRSVSVGAGETETVDVQMDELPRQSEPPPALTEAAPKKNDDDSITGKWWFWVITGAAAVAVAGVAVGVAVNTGGDDFVPAGELPRGSSAEWERF